MRLSSVTILLATAAYVSAYPLLHWRKRDVNPAIVPDFGWESGVNPTGTGDCDGAPGTNVKIPCFCPPPRDVMLKALNENIAAGYSVNNTVVSFDFPTDNSIQSEIARINGVLVTLQNLSGPGVGCPAASTTLNARRKALQDQLASGKVNVPATPVITTTTVLATATEQFPADRKFLANAHRLGMSSSANFKITPLPAEQSIVLTVKVDFPLDDSVASKKARIVASLITIQNLSGPGVGCPAVSTTLSQQLSALG
ncbi:hypothetical protein FRB90_009450 [Tulasnella sp. 427]|nr:hypothetical protein FRB90_009450 [Tulasnella sp. 427]